jgi:hypothetical protein
MEMSLCSNNHKLYQTHFHIILESKQQRNQQIYPIFHLFRSVEYLLKFYAKMSKSHGHTMRIEMYTTHA